MDQKMKRFDRNIEQMMNESEVAPPFGMWNRISAQLDAEIAAVPPPAASPIPQRALYGFIAGALIIGASLITAYMVNESNKQDKLTAAKASASTVTVTDKNTENTTPVMQVTQSQPVVAMVEQATKTIARKKSKPVAMAAPATEAVEETKHEAKAEQAISLPAHAEVLVPNHQVAENNVAAVSEPYFFPAVDNITVPETKTEKQVTVAKTTKSEKSIFSSSDAPRIKFRPKKHRSFSYGKIISKR
ncbi:MAG: hypothetical protein KA841_06430 [Chitinophagales bacterium]|nr:hypothetical protein [Chitinophagales bacterium]